MKWLWIAGAVVVTAALAVVIVAVMKPTGKHEPQTSRAGSNSAPATVAVGADTPPPWPAPVDVSGRSARSRVTDVDETIGGRLDISW